MKKKKNLLQFEEKKRYKQYKAKKNWVTAPIVVIAFLGTTAFISNEASADEFSSTDVAQTQKNSMPSTPTKVVEDTQETSNTDKISVLDNDTTKTNENKDKEQSSDEGTTEKSEVNSSSEVSEVNQDGQVQTSTEKETAETKQVSKQQSTSLEEAVRGAEKAGVVVQKDDEKTYPNKEQAQKDVNEQIQLLDSATNTLNEANSRIQDAVEKAKSSGTVVNDGGTLQTTIEEALSKAKEIVDSIQSVQTDNAEIRERNRQALEAYETAKAELIAKNEAISKENEAIAKRNQERKEQYEKELEKHNRTKEEYENNKNKEGYTQDPIEKYLHFDRTATGNGTITKIELNGNHFIDSQGLQSKYSTNALHELVAKDLQGLGTADMQKAKTGHPQGSGYFVQFVGKNQITVTYENLNASYDKKRITKAQFTYQVVESTSKNDTVGAYFFDDASKTIVYGFQIGKKDTALGRIKLTVKFFDENGNEVKAEKGKPFAYSVASLNSRGANKMYEFVEKSNATYHKINNSKIDEHGNRYYSQKDIDMGTEGIDVSDWDNSGNPHEYYGAGVMTTEENIEFVFGNEILENPGLNHSSNWFAFNTELKSFSISPKPAEPTLEQEKPLDLTELTPPTPEELKEATSYKLQLVASTHPVKVQEVPKPTEPQKTQEAPKLEVQKQDVLPQTGEQSQSSFFATVAGIMMLVSLGFLRRKKK